MSRSAPDPDARTDAGTATVETIVEQNSGEWVVDIAVMLPDGVIRHTVNKYRSKREADIAASWIQRGADRDIEGPIHG